MICKLKRNISVNAQDISNCSLILTRINGIKCIFHRTIPVAITTQWTVTIGDPPTCVPLGRLVLAFFN